eukprot:PhF_6_TR41313/c0_g1_i1/m.62572/K01779/racD; aspartate racemase
MTTSTSLPVDASTVHQMPTVGILTGISHQSGIDYYTQINDKIQQTTKWKYAGNSSKVIMYSLNLEEYVARLAAGRFDMVSDLLAEGAVRIHRAGADFLAIASNTGHLAIPRITTLLPHFPILHIADCCANKLKRIGVQVVGLVGTKFTMTQPFLKQRLEQHNIRVVVPREDATHTELERVIEKELSFGKFIDASRNWLTQTVIRSELVGVQGAQAVILGCTEIGLLIKQNHIPDIPVLDSAQEHIDAIVDIQLGKKNVREYDPNFVFSKL